MSAIVNTNLAGFTVTYNGVQFGGLDSSYKSYPPFYHLRGEPHWDDSKRSILWIDYTLSLRCIFFHDSESQMATNRIAISGALNQAGRLLKIEGLGLGFNSIFTPGPGNAYYDLMNGPRPLAHEWTSLGQICWELSWGIQFSLSECIGASTINPIQFTAFNFNTSWRNDYEGMTTRVIQGYVSIPGTRSYLAPKTILHVAEETRGKIIVDTPIGFKRTENIWSESDDKLRLNFTIVDEQLQGDAYPPGIVAADGNVSFTSGGEGNISMARGITTLSMNLKTAYNQPRNLAGRIFLVAALSKQAEMQTQLTASDATKGVIIPIHLSIANGKWDSARQTQASISWVLTQTLNSILSASKIWTPVSTYLTAMGGAQDYTQWRASMSGLIWDNRGTSAIAELASESVIIDFCDGITTKTIGITSSTPNTFSDSSLDSLSCPSIPNNGGWIHFDLDIKTHRDDNQTRHRRASSYLPANGQVSGYMYDGQPTSGNGSAIALGGSSYSQSASDNLITEYHGFPEFLIGLSFSGLRYKNCPFMPEIKTVAGQTVTLVSQEGGTPKQAFDSFGCPVWSISGYRVYSVPGYVATVKPISSLASADTSIPYDL